MFSDLYIIHLHSMDRSCLGRSTDVTLAGWPQTYEREDP